ncbi:MAG TPA: hypothetical protein VFQ61_18570, partial [Polyangiaceae bacterium]|nr:hypothetical protein [Polyangiaceae bacterium]
TPGLLERGPITVFEKASFLGQGMLEPLPPRATATVPFALERSVAIGRDFQSDSVGSRIYRVATGQLWIERDSVNRSIYKIDNGGERNEKLLIKHPRTPGTRLFKPPAGTEDNEGSGNALIPVALPAHAKTQFTVEERRSGQETVDWLGPLADDAIKAYVADSRANPDISKKLSAAWGIRETLRRTNEELQKLNDERAQLESASDENRRNLKAIEKNPQAADLRAKLTRRLAEGAARLDAITKRTIELEMVRNEQGVRFRDAVGEIHIDGPLPPRD